MNNANTTVFYCLKAQRHFCTVIRDISIKIIARVIHVPSKRNTDVNASTGGCVVRFKLKCKAFRKDLRKYCEIVIYTYFKWNIPRQSEPYFLLTKSIFDNRCSRSSTAVHGNAECAGHIFIVVSFEDDGVDTFLSDRKTEPGTHVIKCQREAS